MVTKQEYLKQIARLLTGENLIVEFTPDKSLVMLNTNPVVIKIRDTDVLDDKKYSASIDLRSMSKALGYDTVGLKLFMQRMMLYHECGHIMFTPNSVRDPPEVAMKTLINFTEDLRVESRLSAHYPPARYRLDLMNRMLLAKIDVKGMAKAVKENPDPNKNDIANLSTVLAGFYFYGLAEGQPKSPVVAKMVETMQEYRDKPTKNYKHTENTAEMLYKMLPDDLPDEMMDDSESIADSMNGHGQFEGNSFFKNGMPQDLKDQIDGEFSDFKADLKAWGLEEGDKTKEIKETIKYVDYRLVSSLSQTLNRILGGKPSKHDFMEYDGHSLDIESYMEYIKNDFRETKMYLKAGKREKVEMLMHVAIDTSGSMSGQPLDTAKMSAINLAMACERSGIKTCISRFDTTNQVMKDFNQYVAESNIGKIDTSGGTMISCAVQDGVKFLDPRVVGGVKHQTKRAMIIITDGGDGSHSQVANLLKAHPSIRFYMIGINTDIRQYANAVRSGGATVHGCENVSPKTLYASMTAFAKDFVRTV